MLKFLGLLYFDDNLKTCLKIKHKIKSNSLQMFSFQMVTLTSHSVFVTLINPYKLCENVAVIYCFAL